MARLRALIAGHRPIALLLLAAVLALRVAVPAGWMPQAAGSHGLVLSICDGSGSHTEVVALGKSRDSRAEHSNDAPAHANAPCPYAVLGLAMATPLAPALADGAAPRATATPSWAVASATDDPAHPPRPPGRAPPRVG